jgi:molecular chaperone GrpE
VGQEENRTEELEQVSDQVPAADAPQDREESADNENGAQNGDDVRAAEEAQDDISDVANDDEHLQKIAELQKQADENYQRFLRVQADFENFRRRTNKEKAELAQYASAKLIEQLLPVIDNFERAIYVSKENKDFDAFAKGIEMIYQQTVQVLAQEGLKPIEAVGRPFNPDFHQAVMQVEKEGVEEGTVVEELQKGYMFKEKVLRPSMVKVSK